MSDSERLAQSIRHRLSAIARKTDEDVQRILVRYAIERLLYRLSISPYRERFILKGATLFSLWAQAPYRSTGDLDLLGQGDNSPGSVKAVFSEIAGIVPSTPDALHYETENMRIEPLRARTAYAGVSLRFSAKLARATLPILIDIGFGDAVTPAPDEVMFPSLLDMPKAHLRSYPPPTVIAEKVEAMVSLGLLNTRVKDLYDVWAISQAFDLDGDQVVSALRATFGRRGTRLEPSLPAMLTDPYLLDPTRQNLWLAFLKTRAEISSAPRRLEDVAAEVAAFLSPVLLAASENTAFGTWRASRTTWEQP